MQRISRFTELAARYDALLCDLWGVIHDGENLYPGVLDTLEHLHHAGKKVVFLSNAPRLAESVAERMDAMGVRREWYRGAMTSGEAAARWLEGKPLPMGEVGEAEGRDGRGCARVIKPSPEIGFRLRQGFSGQDADFDLSQWERYYYLGLEKDRTLLARIPQREAESLEQADWLLNSHFEYMQQPYEEVRPLLEQAAARKLPMLCINPDIEVVKLDGTRIYSAGYLAARYEEMGGQAAYVGKPYPLVYEYGLALLADVSKDKVLMVGDNLHTDIKGGKAAGLDTALVTGGVLKDVLKPDQTAEEYCRAEGIEPDWLVAGFGDM